MSHFLTVVILPPNVKDINKGVADALAPFDENKRVAKYERDCYCVGKIAAREATEACNREFGTIDDLRKRFWEARPQVPYFTSKDLKGLSEEEKRAKLKEAHDMELRYDKEWKTLLEPREKFEKEFLDKHPKKNEPDPTCGFWTEELLKDIRKIRPDAKEYMKLKPGDKIKGDNSVCFGTGKVTSTYNPISKYDYWVIGGRYTGAFVPDYDPTKDPENLETCSICNGTGKRDDELGKEMRKIDPDYTCSCDGEGKIVKFPSKWRKFAGDVMIVRALPKDFQPFAIVVPGEDGGSQWLQRGEVGWWGMVSNEKDSDDWAKTCKDVFKKFENHIAVCCDLHI